MYVIYCLLFVAIAVAYYLFTDQDWNPIVCDGIFYYTHLPSFFIYNDLDLNFLPNFVDSAIIEEYCVHGYIKYPLGCAYLQAPFFLIAHSIALIVDKTTANGYSFIYRLFMEISSICFLFIGNTLNYKILKKYISKQNAQFSIVAITLGSGLLFYTCFEATMSHVYSYFAITLFVYIVIKMDSLIIKNKKYAFFIGLSLGLVTAIKNINILIILIYLFYNVQNFQDFKTKIINFLNIKNLFYFLCGFIVFLAPQMLYWYNRTGYLIINSYHPENYIQGYENYPNVENCDCFYFNRPLILSSLFSLRKGFFIYYPALLYSIFGLVSYRKFFSKLKYSLPIFITIIIYLYSCFGCWYAGWSFGLRFYLDYMVLFSILISSFLEDIYNKNKKTIYPLIIVLLVVLIIMTNILCYLVFNHYGDEIGSLEDMFKNFLQNNILFIKDIFNNN